MSADSIKPVYVLHGTDAFLLDAHRREVVALALGEADPQIALSSLDGTASPAEVFDELRTLPFLAPRRVVVLSDADAFVSANRERLETYLAAPSATATLILIIASWRRATRVDKLIQKIGEVRDCNVSRANLGQWLARAAGKRGKKLAPAASELLLEWIGENLASLDNEIEKLSLYVGDRQRIEADDVSVLVTASAGPAAFALTNALTEGNVSAALNALSGMLTARGEEFRVVGMIASHLRKVLRAQRLAAAGRDPQSILNPRMPHRAKSAFLAMVRRRPLAQTEKDFRLLIRTDLAMKSGSRPDGALRDLVASLCL